MAAKDIVSLEYPSDEGFVSKNPGLTDDGARRADVWGLTGTWENSTLKISSQGDGLSVSTISGKDNEASLPVFLTLSLTDSLEGANNIKITRTDSDSNWVWQCITDNNKSVEDYKNVGYYDTKNATTVGLKFGKSFAAKNDQDKWEPSGNANFKLEIYKDATADESGNVTSEGILLAECTFTLDFSGITITGQD